MQTTQPRQIDVRSYRLTSIDMLRGLIVVIMALDHVRDFTMSDSIQDPLSAPNVSIVLYLTRWITHFCAPVFIFLAGTSAGLMTSRKTPTELAGFLAKRGVWLLAIEILLVSSTITLTPITSILYGTHIMLFLQTLWAIGTSMIVLAALQFLGAPVCLGLGLVIVLGHNLLDGIWPQNGFGPTELPLWAALHTTMFYSLGPVRILFYYPILPWAGLMLTGFGSAGLFRKLPDQRNALLLKAGLAIVVAFLVLRGLDIYGDPKKWHAVSGNVVASAMSFLNTSKYPPSLLYVLMTLGPAAILCSQADRMRGWLKDTLVMFGRVPFAFYVAHFMLARLMGLLIGEVEGFNFYQMTGFGEAPKHMGVSLGGVYLVWIAVVAMLYPLCRWVAAVKARRSDWWLSYL